MAVKKQTTPPPPRSLEEIEADMHRMASMSCKPSATLHRPAVGTIIDENQTVKWNREEVQRQRDAYDQKVKELNTKKNLWRDRLSVELYERMVLELDGKITTKGAEQIFAQAYSDGHANGVSEVFIYLRRYLELFSDVLNAKEDK